MRNIWYQLSISALILIAVMFSGIPANAELPEKCGGCPAESKCNSEKISSVEATTESPDGKTDEDEFEEFKESASEADDGFEEWKGDSKSENEEISGSTDTSESSYNDTKLFWVLIVLAATAIAGILVRFPKTRNFKTVFLVASLAMLGFYRGGCPCMISSMQDVALAGMGLHSHWIDYLWFLGLIPLTYVFGQVWCGWVCHLGAFQEFLFKRNKIEFLKSEKSQKVMKIIRYVLLTALLVQLFITKSNLFIKIDPFMVAFNLNSYYTAGWILLGLLLITSLFINRPFCRAACPVGLILGWVKKIPGASVLGAKENCTGCITCAKGCDYQAINRKVKLSILDNKDCILCGDCMDNCRKESIQFYRNNNSRKDKAILEKMQ